ESQRVGERGRSEPNRIHQVIQAVDTERLLHAHLPQNDELPEYVSPFSCTIHIAVGKNKTKKTVSICFLRNKAPHKSDTRFVKRTKSSRTT
ncbi:unnamed protein product, partial [Pylaiella littoralis]